MIVQLLLATAVTLEVNAAFSTRDTCFWRCCKLGPVNQRLVRIIPYNRAGASASFDSKTPSCQRVPRRSAHGTNDSDDALFEEEGEEYTTSYGSRSLSWTNKYRKLLPYQFAKSQAMSLGLQSQHEWERMVRHGEHPFGAYVPRRPEEMYHDDWVSWDDFLGVRLPYPEAQQLVKTLQLQSRHDYHEFVEADRRRAEHLRLPAQPDKAYRESDDWSSWEDFLGTHQ